LRAAAIALVALAIGVGGLLMIGTAVEILRDDTCREVNRSSDPEADCFPGSVDRRALLGAMLVGSGIAAFGATIAGFYTAARGRRPGVFAALTLVAVLFFIGALVVARAP
jgi:hypothetical protein